jgi:predicted nuclease with RNAse H fold
VTIRSRSAQRPVLGLDLAGSPTRRTGCCVLAGPRRLVASVAYSDEEIRALVHEVRPKLIIIDAPLSLPRGRRTIEDRFGPHLRECDRELLRRRIRFFPLTLGPMRMLTERGMRLASEFAAAGFRVVEGYPGASQDILRIPRKKTGVAPLRRGLLRLGLRGDVRRPNLTHDELDAVTIAWVGRKFLAGRGELIGDPTEGLMVLPISDEHRRRAGSGPGTRDRTPVSRG